MQKKLAFILSAFALPALADQAQTIAFTGLFEGQGVDAATSQQYVDCLQAEWLKKGAFALVKSEEIQSAASGGECGATCGQNLGADLVVSGSIATNKYGYLVSLNMLEVSTGKTERIDWNVIGDKKDLMNDGCKNGAAVVYNYQVTPDAKVAVKLPSNYNAEKSRDHGMEGGVNNDLILVKERAQAERAKAMNQKNPDSKGSGGEKGGR